MTKQEEIREEVACVQCGNRDICNFHHPVVRGKVAGDVCSLELQSADRTLAYLYSEGVVLKVDRELPTEPYRVTDTANLIPYCRARREMIEAGYVAVEPLIEVK